MENKSIVYSRKDNSMHIMEKLYTDYIIKHIINIIARTPVTPNMVTMFNMLLSFYTLYLAYNKHFIAVAIFIQVYTFLDNLDGILARYKNMKSKLGAELDVISDTIFYNGIFILVGVRLVNVYWIISLVLIFNFYGVVATYYIVPRLKKLRSIKRGNIKQFFLDCGYIVGMNTDTAGIIMFIFLLIGKIKLMYIIIISLFIFDMIYRMIELKYNEVLDKNYFVV
ncbi:CDP-alcohol phosphatidyltransferase family protein [Clostridium botulinum]|uniref:CDP-alcohol phosphatidyltransferase family protein n=1 Tax=Clostridium botulinum TaxID=1491 RepID=UPI0013F0BA2C|nr:CDP-alcohol phosphatidyltransferase family protein [Clostridium botulinum]MBY6916655.1 CDP-alcohol phosphatidyltransferase family protein [Clostridium botulinum]NFL36181.1 CDP-alcohol phosphatidyltransferase family protein [Clostridium botulinum]NFM04800.1 CDP-alcohol phosphatidyltransferase family protein [Clostridium botulinum]NFO41184.1 CDP-alcohol phosphatidyltransferase family protein [Clostridium botulinum]NFQ39389.1 CDP-alcohol phosphatidyltransferase family protein [Clostridium botu